MDLRKIIVKLLLNLCSPKTFAMGALFIAFMFLIETKRLWKVLGTCFLQEGLGIGARPSL